SDHPRSEEKQNLVHRVSWAEEGLFCRRKPRATSQIQVKRAWKGSGKPVRGFHGSGSTDSQPVKASARVTRQWVKRT
ncbi:hypothetical protein HAX54_012914, partial [Datura stramonium]|nr:hypothetical protein [Datura stramonium]